jgi:hypothetical protein
VVRAVGGVEQRFGSRRDVAAVVQHDLADLDAHVGATRFPGAQHRTPFAGEPDLQSFRLGGLA